MKVIMKNKFTRSSLLFFIAYVLWVTVSLLKYTYIKRIIPISDIVTYTKYVVYILLLLKFIDDRNYRFQNFVGAAIVFFIGYIEYSVQDHTVSLFMLLIFIFSSSNVDFDDILKITLFIEIAVFVVTIMLSFKGIIPNNIWDAGNRHRYDLGFIFCTFGSHLMFFITMVYSCIRKKITLLEMMIILAMNLWLFKYTNTRLDLCLVIAFLVIFYLWTHFFERKRRNIMTILLFEYSAVIIAFVSIMIQALYSPNRSLFVYLDKLLSGRLHLGKAAIEEYGFTLLGQSIRWVGQGGLKNNPALVYNYVDCSFLKYTLNYGVIFFVLLLIGLVFISKKAVVREEHAVYISLLLLYVFAMIDAELCVLAFHPFLLKIGEVLNPVVGEEENEKEKRTNYIS